MLQLAGQDKAGLQQISKGGPDIIAQIWYAVKNETCMTVSDFMLRRSVVGLRRDQGNDAVMTVADEMAKLLNWGAGEKDRQVREHKSVAALAQKFRNP